jgi:tetratricopeptide (TPR) repeat protein
MNRNEIIETAARHKAKGAYDKALKEYQKVLDVDPTDGHVLQKVAELYQKKNDNNQAAHYFARVAEIYCSEGSLPKAIALYKQVLKLDPSLLDVNLKLAVLHQQSGLISEAVAYLQLLANHYAGIGDTRQMLDSRKRIAELDPDNVEARLKLSELYELENMPHQAAAELKHAARCLKNNARTQEYLRVAERVSALEPENIPLAKQLAGIYLKKGDPMRALARLQAAFLADGRDVETLGLLAEAFQGLGQSSKTISVYKELAKVYQDTGRHQLAKDVWGRIVKLDPRDPDALARSTPPAMSAGIEPALDQLQGDGSSEETAEEAELKRHHVRWLLKRTDGSIKYQLYEKALSYVHQLFGLEPDNLAAHELAYRLFVAEKNATLAFEQLLSVLRLCTRRAEVQRAQPYLAAILKQAPEHPEVPAFLAVLRLEEEEEEPQPAAPEESQGAEVPAAERSGQEPRIDGTAGDTLAQQPRDEPAPADSGSGASGDVTVVGEGKKASQREQEQPGTEAKPPRVFVVYSQDSDDHKRRVLELVARLREDGIDCRLDRFVMEPPGGWALWSEREIKAADKVLVVCTEVYRRRFDGEEASGKGKGARWEGKLIRELLFDAGSEKTVFIPVVFDEADVKFVPLPLSGGSRYLLPVEYPVLLSHLKGQASVRMPPVGQGKPFPPCPSVQVASPGMTDRPEPVALRCNKALEELLQRQKLLYAEKEALVIGGKDTAAVQRQILEVKRTIREGGQLQPEDLLYEARFRLLESIGKGGFGKVWRAYDRQEQQLVAVKVLHSQYADDSSRRVRLFRGARQMAKLSHPGIVRVILKEAEDHGFFFFVMEYVEGCDLGEAVRQKRIVSASALRCVLETTKAVQYAHEQGLIHRDLTPANILIEGGRPKLTDFDLVWAADTTGGTKTGGLGTQIYSAPETMGSSEPSVAMDVYSLGMCAVFSLYGDTLPPKILRDCQGFIQRLPCSESIQRVLICATEFEPDKRFKTMADFAQALEAALGEEAEERVGGLQAG